MDEAFRGLEVGPVLSLHSCSAIRLQPEVVTPPDLCLNSHFPVSPWDLVHYHWDPL